jgi:hypothetical protein
MGDELQRGKGTSAHLVKKPTYVFSVHMGSRIL